jgi:subtilisin family serine protease
MGSFREGVMKKRLDLLFGGLLFLIPVFMFILFTAGGKRSEAASGRQFHFVSLSDSYRQGELLVKMKPGTVPAMAAGTLSAMGSFQARNIGGDLQVVQLPPGVSMREGMSLYNQDPNVLAVSPNYLRKALQGSRCLPQAGEDFTLQWNMDNPGAISGYVEDADVDGPEAWCVTEGTYPNIIAIVDSGVDYTHPDLAPNMWVNQHELEANVVSSQLYDLIDRMTNGIDDDGDGVVDDFDGKAANISLPAAQRSFGPSVYNGGWRQLPLLKFDGVNDDAAAEEAGDIIIPVADDFDGVPLDELDSDANGYVDDIFGINSINDSGDPMDDYGHGTHVAGIIGAANNGFGVVGVNHNVRIMACKFIGTDGFGSIGDEIESLHYISYMARVFDEPIVAVNASYGSSLPSFTIEGPEIFDLFNYGILFVAAAGNGDAIGNPLDIGGVPHYPAAYSQPHVLAIAATDYADYLASFSNFSKQRVHLSAPGRSIWSTLPDNSYGSGLTGMSGTSMATPHVTGAVGLLYSYITPDYPNPGIDYTLVRNSILTGSQPDSRTFGKTISGRRLSLIGALNSIDAGCSGKRLVARLTPATSEYVSWIDPSGLGLWYTTVEGRNLITAIPGQPVTFSLFNLDCSGPSSNPFTVTVGGQAVNLNDLGNSPDIEGGDGIFAGDWTPTSVGSVTASFPNEGSSSSSYTDSFTIRVIETDQPDRRIVADAGRSKKAKEGSIVELDGSLSSAAIVDVRQPIFYSWECLNACGLTISEAESPFPYFTAPAYIPPTGNEEDPDFNEYTFKLSVYLPGTADNGALFPEGVPATDTVKVTVEPFGGGGSSGSGTPCFIATAAYGTDDVKHLSILRSFRDECLMTTFPGRTFVRLYYAYSPPFASFIAKHSVLRAVVRAALLPLVAFAYVALMITPLQKLLVLIAAVLLVSAAIMSRNTKRQPVRS